MSRGGAAGVDTRGEIRRVSLVSPIGVVEVEGEVYGLWAVTPKLRDDNSPDFNCWAVTHTPTGRAVGSLAYGDRRAVQRLAQRMARNFTAPTWDTTDTANIPEEEYGRAQATLRAWLVEYDYA